MLAATQSVTEQPKPRLPIEYVHDNVYWRGAAACISVCVPVYRYDVSALLDAIAACKLSALVELVFYDDGSGDTEMLTALMARAARQTWRSVLSPATLNRGRSAARNAATRHARGEWTLLLDADMLPDGPRFLEAYFDAVEAASRPPSSSAAIRSRQRPGRRQPICIAGRRLHRNASTPQRAPRPRAALCSRRTCWCTAMFSLPARLTKPSQAGAGRILTGACASRSSSR